MTRPPRPPLPLLGGVSASCVATPPVPRGGLPPWALLLDFLAQRFPKVSRANWAQRMVRGEVLGERGEPLPADAPYRGGQRVFYYRWVEAEPAWPGDAPGAPPQWVEQVIYRDEHLLVVDKPHFMPVSPGGRWIARSLLARLKFKLGLPDLSPLHRLDRETAGVMLLSLNPASRGAYQALFRQREVQKTYHAIAPWKEGRPWPQTVHNRLEESPAFMQMHEVIGEANAHTAINPIKVSASRAWARYELMPLTGKKHQLRAHMAGLGLPLLNDTLYPVLQAEAEPDFGRPLQLLARHIALRCPVRGVGLAFQSRLTLCLPD
jgi:tRNA pseudouridine32 synthase/23S rRNA pseudouridine746 synthase